MKPRYWHCVSDTQLEIIAIDQLQGNIWGMTEDTLSLMPMNARQRFGLPQNFHLPISSQEKVHLAELRGLCPTELVWVVTTKDAGPDKTSPWLVAFNPNDGSRLEPPVQELFPQAPPRWYCFTSQKNQLVIWNHDDIGLYDGRTWVPLSINFQDDDRIAKIHEDHAGNLWALTFQGKLMKRELGASDWVQFSQIENMENEIFYLTLMEIEVSEKYLYLFYAANFYRFSLNREVGPMELISSHALDGPFIKGIFEDAENNIWLVWDDVIVRFTPATGESVHISYPFQDTNNPINGSVYDSVLERLYLATEEGVYYLETSSN